MTRTALKTLLVAFAVIAGTAAAGAQDHLHPCPFKTAPAVKDKLPAPDSVNNPTLARTPAVPLPGFGSLFLEPRPVTEWDRLFAPKPVDPRGVRASRVMDSTRLPAERAIVRNWAKSFPRLREDFEVFGPCTAPAKECRTKAGADQAIPGTYNCIAHTAGITNIWVNPYQKADAWDMYYTPLGYKLTGSSDTRFEEGRQKVAVYATRGRDGKLQEYTHAAIQEPDGTWSSKLGSGPLIRHRTAESVCGPDYGEVVRVYVRKK